MLRYAVLIFVLVLAGFREEPVPGPRVDMVNFEQLEPYLHRNSDSLYLVNFWATWCSPCREELPVILQIEKKYRNDKFKVLLVSLDFPKQLESRLKPFIRDNKINTRVVLLNDPDQNKWIDKVDPSWSGELPFTVIYSKNTRSFYSKPFKYHELDSIINLKLKTL